MFFHRGFEFFKYTKQSVVNNGTCSNFNNPKGHTYVAMCYDGKKCQIYRTCLKNIKDEILRKYRFNIRRPSKTLCTPYI